MHCMQSSRLSKQVCVTQLIVENRGGGGGGGGGADLYSALGVLHHLSESR